MRLIWKTMNKVVIEVHKAEIEEHGFDFIWDKIRRVYKIKDFDIFSVDHDKKTDSLVFVELIPIKHKVS